MPYDDFLASRVREFFGNRAGLVEKKMFGGVGFLLNGNMCVGVWKEQLIVRVGVDEYEEVLAEPHTREFDITGRPMRGWAMIEPEGTARDEDLGNWINRALEFAETLPPK